MNSHLIHSLLPPTENPGLILKAACARPLESVGR